MRPTYHTKCAYVEQTSGRVSAPALQLVAQLAEQGHVVLGALRVQGWGGGGGGGAPSSFLRSLLAGGAGGAGGGELVTDTGGRGPLA
jgi:hypothetical protein